jgi:predicted phosphoribosyltransferase
MFRDRSEAGARLGRELLHLRDENPFVLAMPRGGVVVGFEVAAALSAPLDVVVCCKLGSPWNEELGFGAVGPGGVRFLDERCVAHLGLDPARIESIAAGQEVERRRREELYRAGRGPLGIRGRTAILVDDGLATGVTARAAILWAQGQGTRGVVLAVPVAPPETERWLSAEVEELVCLFTPPNFYAVGQWYEDFRQVEDEEVVSLLQRASGGAEGSPRRPAEALAGSGGNES